MQEHYNEDTKPVRCLGVHGRHVECYLIQRLRQALLIKINSSNLET
jgi:hypothetical protein